MTASARPSRLPWRARLPRLAPATRIALGLVALMVSLVLLADLLVGFLPSRLDEAQRLRTLVTHHVGAQVVAALRTSEEPQRELQRVLGTALRETNGLRALQVTWPDGTAEAGDPDALRAAGAEPNPDELRLALLADRQRWGELRLVFEPALPADWAAWGREPLLQGLALLAVGGLFAFMLYLRRMLRYLDPNAAVPERVRTAFDTLAEAVIVLDAQHRVMLTNRALRALAPDAEAAGRIGVDARALDWLTHALGPGGGELPWEAVVRDGAPRLGLALTLPWTTQGRRELKLNCAPVTDGPHAVRGCLVTLSDVTELHERTERLRVALADLEQSRAEVERQNEELVRLATRDALTGCLNRRAMSERAASLFAAARSGRSPLGCIMADIDHFKQVNDRFGYAGGDLVIQGAARALQNGLRVGDFVARYGGEEFCLMVPGAAPAVVAEIAERLRATMEAQLGGALRDTPGVRVTMSFGMAMLDDGVADPDALIARADQALYASKKGGRNRVTVWQPQAAEAQPEVESATA